MINKSNRSFPEITKEVLKKMFVENKLYMQDIAKHFNCSVSTISEKVKKFDLKKSIHERYINKRFGKLRVIEYAGKNKYRKQYKCICDCGNVKIVDCCALKTGNTTSCGCAFIKASIDKINTINSNKNVLHASENPNWRGYGEIGATYIANVRGNAKRRRLEFSITIEYIWKLFIKQNRKCALSGLELIPPTNKKNFTASLDRIDSSKGYIEGNVQWLHKDVNFMKSNYSQDRFIEICNLVSIKKGTLNV